MLKYRVSPWRSSRILIFYSCAYSTLIRQYSNCRGDRVSLRRASSSYIPKETLISLSLAFQTNLSLVGSPKVIFYPARQDKTQISHLTEVNTVSMKHVAIIKNSGKNIFTCDKSHLLPSCRPL